MGWLLAGYVKVWPRLDQAAVQFLDNWSKKFGFISKWHFPGVKLNFVIACTCVLNYVLIMDGEDTTQSLLSAKGLRDFNPLRVHTR